jgi:hypothetical protein
MTMADYASYQQSDQQRQLANDIATQEYNNKVAAGESETRALNAAKFAWQQTMDKAGLTGKFEDNWTFPSQQFFTQQFGTWQPGGPTAGQQTLAREQQTFGQGATLGQMYGQYYAPGQAPTAGQQTLNAQQQAYNQWLGQQQEARQQQALQQQTANQYLTLLSNLRGPADWAKYQEVLGATPGGMRDLTAAAMGQYVPGGGATTGMQPQAANLNTLYGQVSGGGQYGNYQPGGGAGGGGANWPQATFTPMGSNQAAYAPNNQIAQPEGRASVYAQPTSNQESLYSPAAQAFQQASGNGTNMYGAPQQNQMNLPAPNQVAAQSWKNMAPSQRDMLTSQYEASGWYKPDVEALMNQALPKYASNAPTAGTWRLR